MPTLLQTKRLYLRNLSRSDLNAVYAYRNDRGCAAYQRWEAVSREAIEAFLQRFGESRFLSEEEEQHYAVCTFAGKLAGDLSYFYNPEDRCITLGITVAPEFQRRGIAREILTAVVEAIQKKYPQLDIVALIHPENRGSIRLFEQLGFIKECYAPAIESCVYVIYGRSQTERPETAK